MTYVYVALCGYVWPESGLKAYGGDGVAGGNGVSANSVSRGMCSVTYVWRMPRVWP